MRRFQVSSSKGVWSKPLGHRGAKMALRKALIADGCETPLVTRDAMLEALRDAPHGRKVRENGVILRVLDREVPPFPSVPRAALLTPATRRLRRIWTEVWLVFGGETRNNGLYVNKTVEGSNYYSEHAWAAAWDIAAPIGYSSSEIVATLTRINNYLRANGVRLKVHRTIWRDKQYPAARFKAYPYLGVFHASHIHLETADHDGRKPPWV